LILINCIVIYLLATVAPYYNVYSAPAYENIGQECYYREAWRLSRRLLIGRQSNS